jgi:hypothetical protein
MPFLRFPTGTAGKDSNLGNFKVGSVDVRFWARRGLCNASCQQSQPSREHHLNNTARFFIYLSRAKRRSPTLRALAIIVSVGLTAALEGKKLPSTT